MSITGNRCHGESFPRALRLLSAADFTRLFKQSNRTGNRHFTVLIKSNSHSLPRVGFAISKKAVKHAVKRNLIKRKLRELFRLRREDLPAVDMVFIAKAPIADADRVALDKSLEVIWKRVVSECAEL